MSRIFFFGFRYPLRRKVSLAFLILFLLLSSFFIYNYSLLDSINTDKLVDAKSIVLEPREGVDISIKDATDVLGRIWIKSQLYAEVMYLVLYSELNPDLGVGLISVWPVFGTPSQTYWKWILSEIKPTTVIAGRFPERFGEALVNEEAKTIANWKDLSIGINWEIGTKINITRGGQSMNIQIVGSYLTTPATFGKLAGNSKVLLYVTPDTFKKYIEFFHPNAQPGVTLENADYVYVRRIVIIAKGGLYEYLQGIVTNELSEIENSLKASENEILPFVIVKGATPGAKTAYVQAAVSATVIFLFAIIGSALYSFLIVKFRHMEIATLRAIGWNAKDVKTYLLAEIFFVAGVAFILSVIAIYAISAFYALPPISYFSIIYSFIIIFIIPLVFGLIVIPRRILRISPAEAFRKA